MRRGELYWADLGLGWGTRPVVVVLRDESLRRVTSIVVAPISSNIRGLRSEVPVGPAEGIRDASAVKCDWLMSVRPREMDARPVGHLGDVKLRQLNDALRFALDVRCPPV
jgi:mRNA interferase MazF